MPDSSDPSDEPTRKSDPPDGKNRVAATGMDLTSALMIVSGLPADWPAAEVRTFRGPK